MSVQELNDAERQILADLYAATDRTVDDLPYTEEFDAMLHQFRSSTGRDISCHEFWKALANLRKASHLVRKKR
jgi:hypothetical protein